jgi:hypothetical protein
MSKRRFAKFQKGVAKNPRATPSEVQNANSNTNGAGTVHQLDNSSTQPKWDSSSTLLTFKVDFLEVFQINE